MRLRNISKCEHSQECAIPPSLLPLSIFCHLSGKEREEDGQRQDSGRERERERETARLLAGVQAVWTDTGGGCGESSHL